MDVGQMRANEEDKIIVRNIIMNEGVCSAFNCLECPFGISCSAFSGKANKDKFKKCPELVESGKRYLELNGDPMHADLVKPDANVDENKKLKEQVCLLKKVIKEFL